MTKQFHMTNDIFKSVTHFDEHTAPEWLRFGGRKGSTCDMRWFWHDHVMTMEVGETIHTDFNTIERREDD